MISGVVRLLDSLGRVTLPKEIRDSLKVNEGDPLHIYVEDGRIIITPLKLQCVSCGTMYEDEDELRQVNGVHLCPTCIAKFGGEKK